MMTEKMSSVYLFVKSSLVRVLPKEYQKTVFKRVSADDMALQILFECCENAALQRAETQTLWKHMKQNDASFNETDIGEAMRMRLQRAANYMNTFADKLAEYVKREYGTEIKSSYFPKKGNHYCLSNFDFLLLCQVDDIELVKTILNRQFLSKKFNNDRFRGCSDNYDTACQRLSVKRTESNEWEMLSSLSMFTIESQFYFDFLYEIVSLMDEFHIQELSDLDGKLTAFCYEPTIKPLLSYLPSWSFLPEITVCSRAIHIRRSFINDIVAKHDDEYELNQALFLESLYLIQYFQLALVYEEMPLSKWILTNTEIADWASVFRAYDVFSAYIPNKNWTNKRIRYAKEVYKKMTFDFQK